MPDDLETLIRKKALKIAMSHAKREEGASKNPVELIREITEGDRRDEIINTALELYGEVAISLFKKLADLHKQGVIKKLYDYELYAFLKNAGLNVPLKTEVKIVRHGREYKFGEI